MLVGCAPKKITKWCIWVIITSLLVISSNWLKVEANQGEYLASHPLPPSLAAWEIATQEGDYFEQIKPTPVGYLVWSQFPIKVYLESNSDEIWTKGVTEAIACWEKYLSLLVVKDTELADIIIKRSPPPIQTRRNPTTGKLEITRASSGTTQYTFYIRQGESKILYHRMTIVIKPGQSYSAIFAASLHELGHAMGIWGHSPVKTDALYFSQVRETPSISARDINTLKKIYQQPTRLGWEIGQKPTKISNNKI